jgi:hypothetical protein
MAAVALAVDRGRLIELAADKRSPGRPRSPPEGSCSCTHGASGSATATWHGVPCAGFGTGGARTQCVRGSEAGVRPGQWSGAPASVSPPACTLCV